MHHFESHLNDEELLLAIDGELSGSRGEKVEEHLAECWDCRARKQSLERTISNLVDARHGEFDAQVQPSAGLRVAAESEHGADRCGAGGEGKISRSWDFDRLVCGARW